jgi:hypothetical protein
MLPFFSVASELAGQLLDRLMAFEPGDVVDSRCRDLQ